MKISKTIKSTLKSAAKKLTGFKRRLFMAETTQKLLDGSARKAERFFGWGRETVKKGLEELESGVPHIDHYSTRGNKRTEDKLPTLKAEIRSLVDSESQADSRFRTTLAYTRITAKAVRQALIDQKGYCDEELPEERTISNILNRMGYRLRRVEKSQPIKKIPEVDEIFSNVHQANQAADADPETMRISIDSKARLKIGTLSRKGRSRGKKAKKASDHDMDPIAQLIPFGILEIVQGLLSIVFCPSAETTDFIVDALELWWNKNKQRCLHIRKLVINLDNGPHLQSHRTQFIKRMVEFAEMTGLKIRLIYYPPYHSKYNPIEHCWGVLENHWNGTILDTIETAIDWAKTMTWKGNKPVVYLLNNTYKHGIKVSKKT